MQEHKDGLLLSKCRTPISLPQLPRARAYARLPIVLHLGVSPHAAVVQSPAMTSARDRIRAFFSEPGLTQAQLVEVRLVSTLPELVSKSIAD